jgi:3-methyl-2-oxobutanoate hydroxymethyltransferase
MAWRALGRGARASRRASPSPSPSPFARTSPLPASAVRHSSHSPLGHPPADGRKKVTLTTLRAMHRKGTPIAMLTAYDFPSAHVADHAGMDMILVGDSLAMVSMGLEDTSEVTLEEMIMCCRSVNRAVSIAFTVPPLPSTAFSADEGQVGDLPMRSYEVSPQQAVASSIRLVKEGRVQAVKLEGGAAQAPAVAAIVAAGIPVLAHVGLTPQRQHALGGFRVQGRTAAAALRVLADARAVAAAGAFAVVLEAVPAPVAALVTRRLGVPTIGIGAGSGCSGQVLVGVDMLGNYPTGRSLPKFVRKYGDVWGESKRAIEQYRDEVKARTYPAQEHEYPISEDEVRKFEEMVAALDEK